jgi:hypothetical protein
MAAGNLQFACYDVRAIIRLLETFTRSATLFVEPGMSGLGRRCSKRRISCHIAKARSSKDIDPFCLAVHSLKNRAQ